MLLLLSPAKKLSSHAPEYSGAVSEPVFREKTATLVKLMQTKSVENVAALMHLSSDLANLNYTRYQDFCLSANALSRSCPALFLFQGDVYQNLQADTWDQKAVDYAQKHLRILSGLYGLLKPLDAIQPYRLEMGVRLENPSGKNLYDFWKDTVTQALNDQLALQDTPLIINLASSEYFKVVDEKKLNYPVITINFYEKKNNQFKMIGILSKKARGMMTKFIVQNQIDKVRQIKEFTESGYRYHEESSSERHLDFIKCN